MSEIGSWEGHMSRECRPAGPPRWVVSPIRVARELSACFAELPMVAREVFHVLPALFLVSVAAVTLVQVAVLPVFPHLLLVPRLACPRRLRLRCQAVFCRVVSCPIGGWMAFWCVFVVRVESVLVRNHCLH